MICFNIVCVFVFHVKDKRLNNYSERFIKIVRKTIEDENVTEDHCKYLTKKLKKISNLMAFDRTLEELFKEYPQQTQHYIRQISSVFTFLTLEYKKKSKLQAAYFPYIIHKYKVFQGQYIETVLETMLELVRSSSLYVRENALQALYSIGDVDYTIRALWILNGSDSYHHPKMISDGLLNFSGNTKRLGERLWDNFSGYTDQMKCVVIDYFRFSSPDHQERILQLLTTKGIDEEIAYRCIRYLGKYSYPPAYSVLTDIIKQHQHDQWIYTAITASALAAYPCDQTAAILKELLHNPNWNVRYNASQSMMALGLYYTDIIDVFEGNDRYAGEIMRYRFDQKKMKEKEALGIGMDNK